MSQRIVLSCRMPHAGQKPGRKESYLERARALVAKAEAHGALLIAWDAAQVGFAWETEGLEEAVGLATSLGGGPLAESWAAGFAQGDIEPLAPSGGASLGWGDALVQAAALARVASPGEVLLDATLDALQSGELLTLGRRIGIVGGRRVRGARLDVRQPWRRDAAAQVARLVECPLVGRQAVLETLSGKPGCVAVLRADPGLGGTRVLHELRTQLLPAPSLLVMPSGLSAEPLGALRRAFARVAATERIHVPENLHVSLDRLLNGLGVTVDVAADLILAHLRSGGPGHTASLLIDDAMEIDSVSREACARTAAVGDSRLVVVVRLDAMADLPEAFASRPRAAEVELHPLATTEAQELAWAATDGALVADASMRWARRGGFSPLGVLEALAAGLATGEIAWVGDSASARRRSSGKGKARGATYWVTRRAEELAPEPRGVITAIGLLGGETSVVMLKEVLAVVGAPVDVESELAKLSRTRWLREPQPGWVALLTRSHRAAVLELVHDARSRAWHRAVAKTIEKFEGPLALAEAAYHAAKAGDGPWAAKLALAASRTASLSRLEGSAMRLVAFARAEDPQAEIEVLREIAASTSRDSQPDNQHGSIHRPAVPPEIDSSPPPPPAVTELSQEDLVDDELPTISRGASMPPPATSSASSDIGTPREPSPLPPSAEAMDDGDPALPDGMSMPSAPPPSAPPPPSVPPPSVPPPSAPPPPRDGEDTQSVALRLSELARKALLEGDAGSLERWCTGLRATGEHESLAERMQAIAQLSHGQIANAVLGLRRARSKLESATPSVKCQASLALGVALAHGGRPEEALLHALDALARAREASDKGGAQACTLFLAKLFDGVSRTADAEKLRKAAVAV